MLPTSNSGESHRIKLDVVEFTLLIHPLDELPNLIDGERHTLLCGKLNHPLTSSVGV